MKKNHKTIQKFEDSLLKNQEVNIQKNLRIIEAMYEEAKILGVFPLKDALDGLDIVIKIARIINSAPKTP